MTRQACDSSKFTAFSQWLRWLGVPIYARDKNSIHYPTAGNAPFNYCYQSSFVSLQNLDYVWHNHADNWCITIEEKTRGGMRNSGAAFAQKDTHAYISGALKFAFEKGACVLNGRNYYVKFRYFGHYLVIFDGLTPSDGDFQINGISAVEEDLLHILKFGKWPTGRAGDGEYETGWIPQTVNI